MVDVLVLKRKKRREAWKSKSTKAAVVRASSVEVSTGVTSAEQVFGRCCAQYRWRPHVKSKSELALEATGRLPDTKSIVAGGTHPGWTRTIEDILVKRDRDVAHSCERC